MPDAPLPIWPNSERSDPKDRPTLTLYRAANPTAGGAAVLVLPGGGYAHLAPHEGEPIALWLNDRGFHAAVLHYRLGPRHRHPAMIQDAQRAIRLMRDHAREWGINAKAIGVLGFSAGGHLASTLAVHYDHFHFAGDDLAGVHPARPDAAVLCYPVIDMAGTAAHTGSRGNLIGDTGSNELLDLLSTHRHVTPETPPTFLWHTADDAAVPLANALGFAQACRDNSVPVELHVYESGRHGLGLATDFPEVRTWTGHCAAFLKRHLAK